MSALLPSRLRQKSESRERSCPARTTEKAIDRIAQSVRYRGVVDQYDPNNDPEFIKEYGELAKAR